MSDPKSEHTHLEEARAALVAAALPHVPFDGWSAETVAAAIADSGVDAGLARLAIPRGALDLALAAHRDGDARMVARAAASDLQSMRIRDKIATLVRFRIEAVGDVEVLRKGLTFFSMPPHASEGAAALWATADLIWRTIGDTSDDLNWYSKRAILSGVYSATVLYWVGDDSDDHAATWAFLDRRIENVMQFEQTKARFKNSPLGKAFDRGPGKLASKFRAPRRAAREDLPGYVKP